MSHDKELPLQVHLEGEKKPQLILPDQGQQTLSVAQILGHHGLPLNTRCGHRGLCDGCRVHLSQGTLVHAANGRQVHVGADEAPVSLRSCEYRMADALDVPVHIEVPQRSRMAYEPQVLSDFRINIPYAHDPLVPASAAAAAKAGKLLGAAVDIGTTTVAVVLLNLGTGEVVGRASGFNQQMHLGDDVLTRINLCLQEAHLVDRLQEIIVNQTIAPLLQQALQEANATPAQLAAMTLAGNTTMLHLLAGENPGSMGVAPFTPVFLEHRVLSPGQLDFAWPPPEQQDEDPPSQAWRTIPTCAMHLLASAGAYVGADLTGGVVASGLLYDEGPSLLVDVGTNGEIILKVGEKLYGCATAAGPAFEGSRLVDGVRAGRGAISHVRMQREPFKITCEVIGSDGADKRLKPMGLCGSAYVDILAEAVACGVLEPTGRFNQSVVPADQQDRWFPTENRCYGNCLSIAHGAGHQAIVISESDIASLMQAKAAIAAGILTLLDRAGLRPDQVRRLFLAGGFGMHMDTESAIRCGLLPGFTRQQIELVGNTSLAGACLALMDQQALKIINEAACRIELVELNLEPGFENHFLDQLLLPADAQA